MDLNNLKDTVLGKAEELLNNNVEGLAEQAKEKISSVVPSEQVEEVIENVKDKVSDTVNSFLNK